jgi:hypothetical protein
MYQVIDMSIYCIYELLRPNGDIFYVGKGKGVNPKRIRDHFNESARGINNYRANVIRKILSEGKQVGSRVIFLTNDEEMAFEKERERIAFYGRENLTNKTDGGEGASGCVPGTEARLHMSLASKGKKKSEGHSKHISEGLKKVYAGTTGTDLRERRSEAIKKAYAEGRHTGGAALKGREFSDEHCLHLSESRKKFFANGGHTVGGTPMRGKKHSDEFCRKISEGKKRSKMQGKDSEE